jgi:hypothetical protein
VITSTPLKLGLAAGFGYTIGGSIGVKALEMVKSDASKDAITGAAWAGRIATTLILIAVLNRVA